MTTDNNNPSFFFDFRELLKPYDFNFIKSKQDVFNDDCECFQRYTNSLLYNDVNFYLWILFTNDIHQPDILRIYLQRKTDKLMIPVIVSENTNFKNLSEYNISDNVINELCCYLSFNYKKLIEIKNGSSEKLTKLYRLVPFNFIFKNYKLNEAEILTPDKTGCSRCIWLDENREVAHGPRIKFQHNVSLKRTREWATLTIDGKFLYDENKDSKFNKNDRQLLLKFMEYNKELISKVFYGEESSMKFMEKCIILDSNGEPVLKNNLLKDESISILNNIKEDTYICVRKKDGQFNVIHKNKYMFNEWFNLIRYDDCNDRLELIYNNWSKTKYHYFKK